MIIVLAAVILTLLVMIVILRQRSNYPSNYPPGKLFLLPFCSSKRCTERTVDAVIFLFYWNYILIDYNIFSIQIKCLIINEIFTSFNILSYLIFRIQYKILFFFFNHKIEFKKEIEKSFLLI